ncbi:uncharacterized protein RSE6_05678 [Rhynchosporium secalis]|uniref:Uncharacterized protein n=1 Tax=Rhynchosporium secalis TaxID=38038 RepID=A0A1E1M8E3_RHYSE|nr:uncharacterized protein RSE6_05678 [Rhynchosporium secalis]
MVGCLEEGAKDEFESSEGTRLSSSPRSFTEKRAGAETELKHDQNSYPHKETSAVQLWDSTRLCLSNKSTSARSQERKDVKNEDTLLQDQYRYVASTGNVQPHQKTTAKDERGTKPSLWKTVAKADKQASK